MLDVVRDTAFSVGDEPRPVTFGRRPDGRLAAVAFAGLLVLDATLHDALSPAARTGLARTTIVVDDLATSAFADIAPFTIAAALQVAELDLAGVAIVDAGAGVGELSLVAAAHDAGPLFLVEYDGTLLERARENMARRGAREGVDVHFVEANLGESEAMVELLRDVPAPAVMLSNVGHWPRSYSITNASCITLLPELPAIGGFVAGGYASWAAGGGLAFERADRERLSRLGFEVRVPASAWRHGEMPVGFATRVADERRAFTAQR